MKKVIMFVVLVLAPIVSAFVAIPFILTAIRAPEYYEQVPDNYLFVEIVEVTSKVDCLCNDLVGIYGSYIVTNSSLYPIIDTSSDEEWNNYSLGDIIEVTWVDSCFNYPYMKSVRWIENGL